MGQLDDLSLFVDLCRFRSLSEAARSMGVSQPVLSRLIQGLEIYYGARLFQRGRFGMKLTAEGAALFAKAKPWADQGKRLTHSAAPFGELSEVRLGVQPSLAVDFLPGIYLAGMNDFRFEIQFDLSKDVLHRLRLGELDFGIIANSVRDSEFVFLPLSRETVGVYQSRNLKQKSQSELFVHPDFQKLDWVLSRINQKSRYHVREIKNYEVLRALVENGAGFGLLPHHIANREKPLFLKQAVPNLHFSIDLVYKSDLKKSPTFRPLLTKLKEVCRSLSSVSYPAMKDPIK